MPKALNFEGKGKNNPAITSPGLARVPRRVLPVLLQCRCKSVTGALIIPMLARVLCRVLPFLPIQSQVCDFSVNAQSLG
jgi:hypothetical protein